MANVRKLDYLRHFEVVMAGFRRVGQRLFYGKRTLNFILAKQVFVEILRQRDVTGGLHSRDLDFAKLGDVLEDALKLMRESINLFLCEVEIGQGRNLQYVITGHSHSAPGLTNDD